MILFPNGSSYKTILLDTNILSNLCKNNEFDVFLHKFLSNNYAACISIQSIFEIYIAEPKGKSILFQKFIKLFSLIPNIVLFPYRSITEQ